jgi:hypothetical protein
MRYRSNVRAATTRSSAERDPHVSPAGRSPRARRGTFAALPPRESETAGRRTQTRRQGKGEKRGHFTGPTYPPPAYRIEA